LKLWEDAILNHKDIRANAEIEKHADWAEGWIPKYDITPETIHEIVQKEISDVFVKVLECAGVYKRTPEGMEAFGRFINTL
jgi:UDPglucose--hexose-1-phosphate uridylyltransferase